MRNNTLYTPRNGTDVERPGCRAVDSAPGGGILAPERQIIILPFLR